MHAVEPDRERAVADSGTRSSVISCKALIDQFAHHVIPIERWLVAFNGSNTKVRKFGNVKLGNV